MKSDNHMKINPPYGRKSFKKYSKKHFTTINIPSKLFNALQDYRKQHSQDNSTALSEAIEEFKNTTSKNYEQFENILIYNPPPLSPRIVRTDFKIEEKHFEFILTIIKGKNPIVNSTSDFIRRVLTWFLREKKFLEKPKKLFYTKI
jgi:hypothetical protein